jgi:ubiquitin-conjugating enzyme E2 M
MLTNMTVYIMYALYTAEDPLNHEAADLYRRDIESFKRIVNRTLVGCVYQGETYARLI